MRDWAGGSGGYVHAVHLDQEHQTGNKLGSVFKGRMGYVKFGRHSHEGINDWEFEWGGLERGCLEVWIWEPSAIRGS